MSLLHRLIARIAAEGPLPFELFMEACLYDREGGFFGSGPLRSVKSGDFLTSPEVSPWFGRILGRFVAAERARIGVSVVHVVDVGAGSGSLLRSMLSVFGSVPVEAWAVDVSPAAREVLATGPWTVSSDVGEIPGGLTGVIVANELLDNSPVALAVKTDEGWDERYVSVVEDALALIAVPAREGVVRWCDEYCGTVPINGMVEVQLAAGRWFETAIATLSVGAVVVIDYGGTAEELEPRRTQGTLRTYRAHHLGPDPLTMPGETDVTVDVNFSALLAVAASVGAEAELLRQDDFLAAWGLRDEISRLRREELAMARGGDPMARLLVRSERTDAETILHPRGLGDFRVLVARVDRPSQEGSLPTGTLPV
jgi:SAM-dependent MidA family methyltransferase